MYCVMWTYQVPADMTKAATEALFAQVADRYLQVPGLIRKYFGFSDDGTTVIGIYLWTTREAADAFYSPAWIAGVTERWGTAPIKSDWTVPVVAESLEGRVVTGY